VIAVTIFGTLALLLLARIVGTFAVRAWEAKG